MSVQSYIQFAQWLQKNHPAVFKQLLAGSQKNAQLSALYGGSFVGRFGDISVDYDLSAAPSFDTSSVDTSSAFDTSGAFDTNALFDSPESGGLDAFTGTADTGPITTDLNSYLTDQANINLGVAGETATATLQAPTLPDTIPPMPASAPSTSASSVGSFLASGSGLLALAKAATTVAGGIVAANVIQAQAQRAAAGQAPANVSYTTYTDPATGIVSTIPVVNTTAGQVPLQSVSSLTPSFLQSNLPLLLLGAAALIYLME